MSTPPRGGRRRESPARRRASRTARANSGSDLAQRVIVAIPAVAVALALIIAGGPVFAIGLFVLGVICLHELFSMFANAHPSRLAGMVGLGGLIVVAQTGDQTQVLMVAMACIPLVFLLIQLQPRGGAPGISVTTLGLFWVGLALAHAVLLRRLPHGEAIVIDILVGTFLGDTGAYLGGRQFGSTKLAPSISPNKTVEGLLAGMFVATLAVWCAGLYQDWLSGTHAVLLGFVVAVFAPLGDLFESYLKRDAGTKDTGNLFGVHGGALDRLDAALFTMVVGFYVWRALL